MRLLGVQHFKGCFALSYSRSIGSTATEMLRGGGFAKLSYTALSVQFLNRASHVELVASNERGDSMPTTLLRRLLAELASKANTINVSGTDCSAAYGNVARLSTPLFDQTRFSQCLADLRYCVIASRATARAICGSRSGIARSLCAGGGAGGAGGASRGIAGSGEGGGAAFDAHIEALLYDAVGGRDHDEAARSGWRVARARELVLRVVQHGRDASTLRVSAPRAGAAVTDRDDATTEIQRWLRVLARGQGMYPQRRRGRFEGHVPLEDATVRSGANRRNARWAAAFQFTLDVHVYSALVLKWMRAEHKAASSSDGRAAAAERAAVDREGGSAALCRSVCDAFVAEFAQWQPLRALGVERGDTQTCRAPFAEPPPTSAANGRGAAQAPTAASVLAAAASAVCDAASHSATLFNVADIGKNVRDKASMDAAMDPASQERGAIVATFLEEWERARTADNLGRATAEVELQRIARGAADNGSMWRLAASVLVESDEISRIRHDRSTAFDAHAESSLPPLHVRAFRPAIAIAHDVVRTRRGGSTDANGAPMVAWDDDVATAVHPSIRPAVSVINEFCAVYEDAWDGAEELVQDDEEDAMARWRQLHNAADDGDCGGVSPAVVQRGAAQRAAKVAAAARDVRSHIDIALRAADEPASRASWAHTTCSAQRWEQRREYRCLPLSALPRRHAQWFCKVCGHRNLNAHAFEPSIGRSAMPICNPQGVACAFCCSVQPASGPFSRDFADACRSDPHIDSAAATTPPVLAIAGWTMQRAYRGAHPYHRSRKDAWEPENTRARIRCLCYDGGPSEANADFHFRRAHDPTPDECADARRVGSARPQDGPFTGEAPLSVHYPLHRFASTLIRQAVSSPLTVANGVGRDEDIVVVSAARSAAAKAAAPAGVSFASSLRDHPWLTPLHAAVASSAETSPGPENCSRMLLQLVEYPIRCAAFAAQARVGLWVRNGLPASNQNLNYASSSWLGRCTAGADVLLMQWGAALLSSPDNTGAGGAVSGGCHLVALLLRHFRLVEWYECADGGWECSSHGGFAARCVHCEFRAELRVAPDTPVNAGGAPAPPLRDPSPAELEAMVLAMSETEGRVEVVGPERRVVAVGGEAGEFFLKLPLHFVRILLTL